MEYVLTCRRTPHYVTFWGLQKKAEPILIKLVLLQPQAGYSWGPS